VAAEHTVHLVFLTVGSPAFPAMHPRVLVIGEPGSRATIVEEYLTRGEGATFTNAVSELFVDANAHLRYLRVQHESEETFHFATVAARLERDANLESVSVALGGGLSRTDLNVGLYGEGGNCTLNGLYAVAGRQTVDHHTFVDHAVPHTSSRQLYKGLLGGHSRAVFNGQILIRDGAQKSDAQQANANLLLSRDAMVNTNPQLRIFADDIKCRHGATIGQMDEDRVFYLRSRGLDEATARRLLMRAFAAEILETLDVGGLGSRLTERVTERFA
jgi:Fe-S cluster assembly protein SufD